MRIPKILAVFTCLLLLLVILPLSTSAASGDPVIKRESIDIEIFLDPSDITINEYNGWDFVDIPGCHPVGEVGAPQLPVKPVTMVVPYDAQDLILHLNEQVAVPIDGDYDIPGTPEPRPISMGGAGIELTEPTKDLDYTLEFAGEGFQRGFRLVTYNLFPIHQLDSGGLEAIIYLSFSLSYTPGALPARPLPQHSTFRSVLEDKVVNPDDLDEFAPAPVVLPTGPISSKDVQYVIVTNSGTVGNGFNNLRDWKTKKGVPAEIVEVTWINSNYNGNDTQEKIRNFLKDAMNTWGIEYCLLGGDTSVVPYRSCYGKVGSNTETDIATDLYYSDLDGDFDGDADGLFGETSDSVDLNYDIIVGRAPVDTSGQLTTFLAKTFDYIKTPDQPNILNATYAGEYLDSSTNSSLGLDTIRTTIVPGRYTSTRLFDASYQTYYSMSKADFRTSLNKGFGIVFHAGHSNYNVMGMGSPTGGTYAWYNADASALSNGYHIGLIYTLGCITTRFNMNDCIAEDHMKNSNGGTSVWIGNSRFGWYSPSSPGNGPSDRYMKRFATEVFTNGNVKIGLAFAEHKDAYVGSSGSDGSYRWLQYALNLLGDPELFLHTDTTDTLAVSHPGDFYIGPQTIRVYVNDTLGSPVSGALVCLQHPGDYNYGITGASGYVDLLFTPTSSQKINVTATAHNYYPYEGIIDGTKNDVTPPEITVNQREYKWWNTASGKTIDVDFDSLGETDISAMQYSLNPSGPWSDIATGYYPTYTTNWGITDIWASMGEGNNTIYIQCNDSAPNTATEQVYVWKDSIAPQLSINQAVYGWLTSDPGAVIDVDFSNGGTGSLLDYAQYSTSSAFGPWDDIFTSDQASYAVDWTPAWASLPQGNTTVHIRTKDLAGNYDLTSAKVYYLKDTFAPEVVVNTDTYGWYNIDPGVLIDVDFTNGGNGSLLDYTQFKIGANGTWTNLSNDDLALNMTNWQLPWASVPEGASEIYVRTADIAGHTDIAQFTFKRDTVLPTISINTHEYGWFASDPGAVIDVDFLKGTAEQSNLTGAEYRINAGPWHDVFVGASEDYCDAWTVSWSELVCGNNTIEVQTVDEAYNLLDSVTFWILKDTDAPIIVVNEDKYPYYNTDPGAVVDIDFGRGLGGPLTSACYSLDGGANWTYIFDTPVSDFVANWSLNWSMFDQGETTVDVIVHDVVDHNSTTSFSFFKDTEAPNITVHQTWYGWHDFDPGDVFDVDFEYGSIGTDVALAQYRVSGNNTWHDIFKYNTKSYKSNWHINWSLMTEGMNYLDIRAFDAVGNEAVLTEAVSLGMDVTPPVITINTDEYGWYKEDPGAVIDVDFDYVLASPLVLAEYKLNLDGMWTTIFDTSCQTYTDDWSINWSEAPDGIHSVYVRVSDEVGFTTKGNRTLTFKKDTTPPGPIDPLSPMNGASVNPTTVETITLRWKQGADYGTGLAYYELYIDDNDDFSSPLVTYQTMDLKYDWTIPADGNGSYYWKVRAADNIGLVGDFGKERTVQISPQAVNRPPEALAGDVMFAKVNEPVSFDGSDSYDPDGDKIIYEWDFDDSNGLEYMELTSRPTFTYNAIGEYTATLKVTDNQGQSDTDIVLVVVSADGEEQDIEVPDEYVDEDIYYEEPKPDPEPDMNGTDSDLDGLPDEWEMAFFFGLDQGANDDFDADGVSNIDEYNAGTDPANYDGPAADDDVEPDDDTEDDDYEYEGSGDAPIDMKTAGIAIIALLVVIVLIMVIVGIVVQRKKEKKRKDRADAWRKYDEKKKAQGSQSSAASSRRQQPAYNQTAASYRSQAPAYSSSSSGGSRAAYSAQGASKQDLDAFYAAFSTVQTKSSGKPAAAPASSSAGRQAQRSGGRRAAAAASGRRKPAVSSKPPKKGTAPPAKGKKKGGPVMGKPPAKSKKPIVYEVEEGLPEMAPVYEDEDLPEMAPVYEDDEPDLDWDEPFDENKEDDDIDFDDPDDDDDDIDFDDGDDDDDDDIDFDDGDEDDIDFDDEDDDDGLEWD